MNWHSGLLGTLQVREQDVDRYYRAYRNLQKITERKKLQVKNFLDIDVGEIVTLQKAVFKFYDRISR